MCDRDRVLDGIYLCSHFRVIVEVLRKVQPEEVVVFVHRERSTGQGSQVFQANLGTAFCTHGRVSGCRSSSGPFVDWCDFGSPTVSSGPGVALSSCRRVVVTFTDSVTMKLRLRDSWK